MCIRDRFYASFGSKVTVLQMEELFIGREDREIADAVKAALEKKGISFIMSANTNEIIGDPDAVKVNYEVGGKEGILEGDALLVATGRRPNTKELNLDQAGVETLPNGAVKTDAVSYTHLDVYKRQAWYGEGNYRFFNRFACRRRVQMAFAGVYEASQRLDGKADRNACGKHPGL